MDSPNDILQRAIAAADAVAPSVLEKFDGVLMLTASQWRAEPGSNRDQYARRLAKYTPVILVEPFLDEPSYRLEATEVPNLAILHIGKSYGLGGALRLSKSLENIGLSSPLVWVFNPLFRDFVELRSDLYTIYHATENYINGADGVIGYDAPVTLALKSMLPLVDLVVSVSEGVATDLRTQGGYGGQALTIPNACDFSLWNTLGEVSYAPARRQRNVVFFEGYINRRLDFKLLGALVDMLPDWDWWFAGLVDESVAMEWQQLAGRSHVKHLGHLPLDGIAEYGKQATVGIIPFQDVPILRKSWPFKAFEYVSFGLPVVSTAVDVLADYPHLFRIAERAEEFAQCIRQAGEERYSRSLIDRRLLEAAAHSTDVRFAQLMTEFKPLLSNCERRPPTANFIASALPQGISISVLNNGDLPPMLKELLGDQIAAIFDPESERNADLFIATDIDDIETFAKYPARIRCAWLEELSVDDLVAETLLCVIDMISIADVIAVTNEVATILEGRFYLPRHKVINLDEPSCDGGGALELFAVALYKDPVRLPEFVEILRETQALMRGHFSN